MNYRVWASTEKEIVYVFSSSAFTQLYSPHPLLWGACGFYHLPFSKHQPKSEQHARIPSAIEKIRSAKNDHRKDGRWI